MTEDSLPSSWSNRHLFCKFFERGFCRDTIACEFSHDHNAVPIPDYVCVYHLQSKCMHGDSCRYHHSTAEDICSEVYPDGSPHSLEDESFIVPSDENCATTDGHKTNEDEIGAQVSVRPRIAFRSLTKSPLIDDTPSSSSKSYAQVTHSGIDDSTDEEKAKLPLCPYVECPGPQYCSYIHGDLCDLCNCFVLHPYNEQQRRKHRDDCVKEHEKEMELSFAIQRSIDKTCGICMDVVMEKEPISERRFGILEKCSHIFCLSCIRKWRQTKQFDNRTIRACPECRVPSDFVVPSKFWVGDKEEKDRLINDYKKAMGQKPCKYFKQGQGQCPFAGACFYLHARPDGTRVEMPPPRQRRVRRNGDGESESLLDVLLWNYIENRDDPEFMFSLDLEDLLDMRELGLLTSTDDESEFSDY